MSRPRSLAFTYDERQSPDVVAMRGWTRQWWDRKRDDYELVTSTAVLVELDKGALPHRQQALAMAQELPAVAVDDGIEDVVDVYIKHKVMPSDPVGDPLHLALASIHKCDYLLTWNCRHLANANKFGHIHRVNALLGLFTPVLTTPLELLGEMNHEDT
jgi:hypothetical protein